MRSDLSSAPYDNPKRLTTPTEPYFTVQHHTFHSYSDDDIRDLPGLTLYNPVMNIEHLIQNQNRSTANYESDVCIKR